MMMATANGGEKPSYLSIPTRLRACDSSESTNRGGKVLAHLIVDPNPSQQPTLRTMDMVTEQTSRSRREGGVAWQTTPRPLESLTSISPRGSKGNSKLSVAQSVYDLETPSDLSVPRKVQAKLKKQRNPEVVPRESLYAHKKDRAKIRREGKRASKLDSKAFAMISSGHRTRKEAKFVAYDKAFSDEREFHDSFLHFMNSPQHGVEGGPLEMNIGVQADLGARSGTKHAGRRVTFQEKTTSGSPVLNGRAGFFGALEDDDESGPGGQSVAHGMSCDSLNRVSGGSLSGKVVPCSPILHRAGFFGSFVDDSEESGQEDEGFWVCRGADMSDALMAGDFSLLPDQGIDECPRTVLSRGEHIEGVIEGGIDEWGELWASWPLPDGEIFGVESSVGSNSSCVFPVIPPHPHQVASDLNGNNGSCTNTDDLDSTVEFIENSVHSSKGGAYAVLHLSLLDRISCVCDKPHSHMTGDSHVSTAHKAFLERQRKRSGVKEVSGKAGPPKEGKKKTFSNVVKFGLVTCRTEGCKSSHVHCENGALALNNTGIQAYVELPDLNETEEEGIEMRTVYGDSLRNESHVLLESINVQAPSETRGLQVVDGYASEFQELLLQKSFDQMAGEDFSSRVDVQVSPNLVLADDVRLYTITSVGVLTNNGSVPRGGGRRSGENMCFLISMSTLLTSRGVFKNPFELQAQFFPDHAQDSEYEIGMLGKDYVNLLAMLADFDVRLELWGACTACAAGIAGWSHTETIGIGSESWHVATFPSHFEPIVQFRTRVDDEVIYFDVHRQYRRKAGGRFNTMVRLLDCRCDLGVEPTKPNWNVRILGGSSTYWSGKPPGRVENLPLLRATSLMIANGGVPSEVLAAHLSGILSSESGISNGVRIQPVLVSSRVDLSSEGLEMVDLHPREPPSLGSVTPPLRGSPFDVEVVNPIHLGSSTIQSVEGSSNCPSWVQPPCLGDGGSTWALDASIPYSPSDNTNSLSRRLFAVMNTGLKYPHAFEAKKDKKKPVQLEPVVVLPKEFHCQNAAGVYVDTAFVGDIMMNMSSVAPDCYSLFQAIEDYFRSLIQQPVAYCLPEDKRGAEHTLTVDLMYETRPTLLWRVLTLNFASGKRIRRPKSKVDVLEGVYTSSMRVLIWKDLNDVLMREASSIGSLSNQEFWTWCIPRYKEKIKALNPDYLSSALVVEHDIHGHLSHSYNTITCNTICNVVAREAMSVGRFALSMPKRIGIARIGKSSFGTSFDFKGVGSVGACDTFMGVIKASRLMCSGVSLHEGMLKQGDNYTVRSTYERRLSGVYDEGFTRILPMQCPNKMDWEFNGRYTFKKGKRFVEEGKITFPLDEEAHLYERLNYSHRYISVYGFAFANSGMVYGVNNHNIARIVERHFKRRQPEQLEIVSSVEYGFPLDNFDAVLLANQAYFAKYLTDDFVNDTIAWYGSFDYYTDVQEAASYLILEKHIKQLLRIDSFDDIMCNGEIGLTVFKCYLVWKLKQMEIAKQKKAPRCIVDAQTANSLPNVHISNAWKAHTADKLVVYGGKVSIEFCSCPSPVGIGRVCTAWDEYSYDVVIKNYSDDSIFGIWDKVAGVYAMCNTDIRANDGSHSGWTWSVFSNLLRMPFCHSEFLLRMIFAENYLFSRDKKSRVTFLSQYGYLPSGIGATTIANNTAMLMVAWMLSRFLNSGFDPKLSLVTYAAYRCGFLLSFESFSLREQYSRMQFLKYSPVRLGDGTIWVIPNLGRILRYSGRSKQDVTVKLYHPPLVDGVQVNVFLWYQTLLTYGDFKRVYYQPLVDVLCPYFHLVDSRHKQVIASLHPDNMVEDEVVFERVYPTREQFYARYISYGATDTMIDEFEGLVSQLALGGVLYSSLVDLVLFVDYGLVSVCSN